MIASILLHLDKLALFYMLGLNSFYALLLLLSIPELWSHWHLAEDEHLTQVLGTEALPPLSILVPAHNEEMTIVDSVISFLTLQYPHHEVVLVNDGSNATADHGQIALQAEGSEVEFRKLLLTRK